MDDDSPEFPAAIYVGIGVGRYEDSAHFQPLPGAVDEVNAVAELLARYRYQTHVIADPGWSEIIDQLDGYLPADVLCRGGSLVILWSGHGEPAPEGLHLIARNVHQSSSPRLTSSNLTGPAVRTGAAQILLVLDTCFSGQGAIPAIDLADRIRAEVPVNASRAWIGVVASAMDLEPARNGAFAQRLLKLLREGPTDPELRLRWSAHNAGVRGDDLIDALQKEWDLAEQSPKCAALGNAWVMLPNPHYDPNAPERMIEHLLLAARGVEPGEEGLYFTGRVALLARIVDWLLAGEPGSLVVTGPAGNGKSAIVGRVASLSNPAERKRLLEAGFLEHADPGENSVSAQVQARGLTAERLVESIDAQLVNRRLLPPSPIGPRNRGELHGAIQRAGVRPVILVDGLEEAGPAAWTIAEQTIRLLAEVSLVLVSTRNLPAREAGLSLVQSIGAKEVLDLGEAALQPQSQTDVRAYVIRRLAGVAAAMDPVLVGEAIVRLAREQDGGAFLLARVVTAQLKSAPIDTTLPGWDSLLDRSIETAFDRDLSRVAALERGGKPLPYAGRELLSALAWAYGGGFPVELWALAATALSPSGTEYGRADCFWLLGQAGRWVVEGGEGSRALYRLAHQRLSEHLRPGWDCLPDEPLGNPAAVRLAQALVARYLILLETDQGQKGDSYLWRYVWRHCVDAGPEGIDSLRAIVARDSAHFLTQLAMALSNLGLVLHDRYMRTGRPDDLEEAIRVFESAVAETQGDSPDLPVYLNNLGLGLRDRYMRTGRSDDLEGAIRISRRVVAQTPEDSPDLPMYFNSLGAGLRERFGRTGRLEDLEDAIRVVERAVAETPAGSPNLPMYLNSLGAGLRERFGRTGRLEDLEEAIRVFERAVAETLAGSPNLPMYLNSLGVGLRERFGRTGRLEDLEEAIRVFERAVAETLAGSPNLPMYLNSLGVGLRERFGRTGRLEDLEEAIRVFERAVAETLAGSPNLPIYLNSLGVGLRERFGRTGRLEDLEEAIRVFERAVAETLAGSPNLPMYLDSLGAGLRERFGRTGRLEDLEMAIGCYRRACELGAISAPQAVLGAARDWGRWAVQRRQWDETAEAYGCGLATGRQLLGRQLQRGQKESVLRNLQEMSGPAAYALAKLGRFEDAVTTVERGRARLLAEALQHNRRDLEQLAALGHADLYRRYREIVETQEQLTQPAAARPDQPDYLSSQARLSAIVAANAAFDQVVAEIQKVPGYADFLAEPTFAQIQAAARDAPLVYLLATSAGGLALIAYADGVQPVWLDELTDATVHESLRGPADDSKPGGWLGASQVWLIEHTNQSQRAWFAVMDDITRRLWSLIMEPVAATLRRMLPVDPSPPPAVTLIPAGLLALLPLHAAWTEDASTPTIRRYFLDEFAVSYAPSALTLHHAREAARRVPAERLLAVEEPLAANARPLPYGHTEVAAIADLFEHSVILAGAQATRQAVRAALPQARVVHFTCHTSNKNQSPLENGLLMSNEETGTEALLTMRDLLESKGAGGRLATLAASETGIIDADLPDEGAMLPSALLQAGFGGVAASLWPVSNLSTAMLMDRFYRLWRQENLPPAQALRAAQLWMRESTNGEMAERYSSALTGSRMPEAVATEFLTKIMARDQDERAYAHPFWWAAFYLTGV